MAHIFKQGVIAVGECVIVFYENRTLSNVNAAPVFAEVAVNKKQHASCAPRQKLNRPHLRV